jgi:hypothetical protein
VIYVKAAIIIACTVSPIESLDASVSNAAIADIRLSLFTFERQLPLKNIQIIASLTDTGSGGQCLVYFWHQDVCRMTHYRPVTAGGI